MKTDFWTIFKNIRNKFDIEHKIGYTADDFIRNMSTYKVSLKLANRKSQTYMKYSDEVLKELNIIEKFGSELEIMCAKPLWRLNQKRVKHGLESWI